MRDLIFIIVTYALLVICSFLIGAFATELGMRWKGRRIKQLTPAQDRWGEVVIVHEWAMHNKWYLENSFLNEMAQVEHMRLMRDEPNLTLQQNLAQVEAIVRKKYPGEFQTLH
ncbi:MAG TPA: hypothetical protein VK652_01115 [Steroidobacteraceae bacterium]|nr:hypothetical protein [Steroidobacteraceae bacterium]